MMASITESSCTYSSDRTLHYLSAGPSSAPLIILIHGWPAIGKTWQRQLGYLSSLGYHVVAPDMPGYGKSTVTRVASDYSIQNQLTALLSLLSHLKAEKAIWIGHDWGCGPVWVVASCYPERVLAVAGLSVAYRMLELGRENLVKYVNRDIYPVDQYPQGQWDYMLYYERSFEEATRFFDADIPATIKLLYGKGNPAPEARDKPVMSSGISKSGGWFGGVQSLPPADSISLERNVLDKSMYEEVTAAMQRTGFWSPDAYYLNHEANQRFVLEKQVNGGKLDIPVLFLEGEFDDLCGGKGKMRGPMRELCENLTEVTIKAGHWLALEKPDDVNVAIREWLEQKVKASSEGK